MTKSQTYGFEDLHAWQRAMDLVDQVYTLTESWPKAEQYGLTNQVRRAAVSVPSNIAEGQGRKNEGDFGRFLAIAYGSLMEVRTQLLIGERRKYSNAEQVASVLLILDETGRLLNGLKRSLRDRSKKA